MRVTSRTHNREPHKSKIEIEGTEAEIVAIEAALKGLYWVSANEDGELIKTKHYDGPIEKEPIKVPDPKLFDFWPAKIRGEYTLREAKKKADRQQGDDPAIFVQHIGGYGGAERYQRNEQLMQAAGFECLRSRRGEDGMFWEIWYLPGAWRAEVIGENHKEIMNWLCQRIGPGEISIEGKHYGLCAD